MTTDEEQGTRAGLRAEWAANEVVLDHPNIGDWRTFLQAHALLSRRLDDELRAEQSMSLAEYDALVQLALAPGRRLRMNQLADRVLLSRSGVTRLVDRLVADELVARTQCTTDARGAEAVLTRAGAERLRMATGTHLRGVARYFLEPLSSVQLSALGNSLGQVVEVLRAGESDQRGEAECAPDRIPAKRSPARDAAAGTARA